MYDILKHREEIRNRILKSFETDDFEKAAAAIAIPNANKRPNKITNTSIGDFFRVFSTGRL